jgi:hypothetical protein
MKSIFGKVLDSAKTFRSAKVLHASGWRGGYHRTGVRTGYHKLMPLADRRELAARLQREARS